MNPLPITIPLSWLYGAGVAMRNRHYDDPNSVGRLETAVISVGNLTVGGSGKTPFVAAVARELLSRGLPVAVLSRGYGRRSKSPFQLVSDGSRRLSMSPFQPVSEGIAIGEDTGDEPLELATSVEGLAVAVGPDRLVCGRMLLERLGPHVLVLDDGFQHRRLHRDLDLVCFDASEPESSFRLLPAGRLREPLASLRRASAVVWTGSSDERPSRWLRETVTGAAPDLPQIRSRTRLVMLIPLGRGGTLPPDALLGEPVAVFVGIARPERVLESLPARVVLSAVRPDHYAWTDAEVQGLADQAKSKGAKAILTTGKDAVKMRSARTDLPLYILKNETEIVDLEVFRSLLAPVVDSL
jgi:tetraacyldisaccharide 4'-kinase